MESNDCLPVGSVHDVRRQSGDAEPTTTPDVEPTTILQANSVLKSIRKSKGYMDDVLEGHIGAMPTSSRDTVLEWRQEKREMEAQYTKNISVQLYSSKYRFIYELIQNAEDSRYTALSGDQQPFLRFTVTPTLLIAETNEDGFRLKDVRSVCATGIEYYLEVKSTTGPCTTRFYMSGGQYKRMEDIRLQEFGPKNRIYVIMRVYDLFTPNIRMKIFVDPLRFKGTKSDFEAEKWFVRTIGNGLFGGLPATLLGI